MNNHLSFIFNSVHVSQSCLNLSFLLCGNFITDLGLRGNDDFKMIPYVLL